MQVFSLDDFPDRPEGDRPDRAEKVNAPIKGATFRVPFVGAYPDDQRFSMLCITESYGDGERSIFHSLNLGGDYGYIAKEQLQKFFGGAPIPTTWDEVANALVGVEFTADVVQNGEYYNVRRIKVTKTVKQIQGEMPSTAQNLGGPAPAGPAPAGPAPAPAAAPLGGAPF